jgi:hypothetical protein
MIAVMMIMMIMMMMMTTTTMMMEENDDDNQPMSCHMYIRERLTVILLVKKFFTFMKFEGQSGSLS